MVMGACLWGEEAGTATPEANGAADPNASTETETVPEENGSVRAEPKRGASEVVKVRVIPMRDQIGSPILDILRRGLKDAIREGAELVVLDMDTPGGELGVTLEIMETLDRFEGETITYVNDEAISAGAYISIATDEIAFAPRGVIGAAEAVSGGGADIDDSMKRKINSYLKAKIRSHASERPYRALVMAAMMDANETLVIEGERPKTATGSFIQKDGELLTLTAEEAVTTYGNPPEPLLGVGVYDSVEDLLKEKYGAGGYSVSRHEVNWAEDLGLWLNSIGPILMGLGMLLLFIEFKTPGFGMFGAAGLTLLLIFFGSKYVAGLAGHEEMLVFLLGAGLVAVEVFLFPGLLVPAVLGMAMMLGALFWAMVDVWPSTDFEWSVDSFRDPFMEFSLGLLVTFAGGLAAAKILPNTPLWNHLALGAAVGGQNPVVTGGASSADAPESLPEVGATGVALTQLYPTGEVEIAGHRYEARAQAGVIRRGDEVRVTDRKDFSLEVARRRDG